MGEARRCAAVRRGVAQHIATIGRDCGPCRGCCPTAEHVPADRACVWKLGGLPAYGDRPDLIGVVVAPSKLRGQVPPAMLMRLPVSVKNARCALVHALAPDSELVPVVERVARELSVRGVAVIACGLTGDPLSRKLFLPGSPAP